MRPSISGGQVFFSDFCSCVFFLCEDGNEVNVRKKEIHMIFNP